MKDWQHGYDLDYLKFIEKEYEPYNRFTYSPFTQYKKNDIAKDLHERKLYITSNSKWVETVCKVRSPITCYHDVKIAWKQPGDVVVSKLCGDAKDIETALVTLGDAPVWVQHWVEDKQYDDMLIRQGFSFIGGKVVTSSEIYGIWFRGDGRIFPTLDPVERITLKHLGKFASDDIKNIRHDLDRLNLQFAKSDLGAYVNKDWSALSLRGYSADPNFIADPHEMSKAWNEKHKGETFTLQNTSLYNEFPSIQYQILPRFDTEIHRISLMRMKPNGVLQRHTDQIDWAHGLDLDKLVRFHIPIKTNANVSFLAWETNGNLLSYNLREGELWVLDTRKPHKVIVNDNEERIHLTIDMRVTQKIKDLMLR